MSSDRIPKMILKYQPTGKRNLDISKLEAFSFVTPVTGLNSPNIGKEDDDEKTGTGTGFPLSISFHHGSPLSYIIHGMNNRPVRGRIPDTV
jgi:hypothetical protein